jgi:hypothetical protein
VSPAKRITLDFTERELDIIIDALWEYQHVQGTVLGKRTTHLQALRRQLVLESTKQVYGRDTAWAMAALPPEST